MFCTKYDQGVIRRVYMWHPREEAAYISMSVRPTEASPSAPFSEHSQISQAGLLTGTSILELDVLLLLIVAVYCWCWFVAALAQYKHGQIGLCCCREPHTSGCAASAQGSLASEDPAALHNFGQPERSSALWTRPGSLR